jgi:hypothetical protein
VVLESFNFLLMGIKKSETMTRLTRSRRARCSLISLQSRGGHSSGLSGAFLPRLWFGTQNNYCGVLSEALWLKESGAVTRSRGRQRA